MFYKKDTEGLENPELLYGNNVHHKDYILLTQDKDSYELPIDGWYWFDTIEEACQFFNYEIPGEE